MEKLIEFDAREMWPGFPQTWPIERRQQFLLRQDIAKPLSTDPMVWPSIHDMAATGAAEARLQALAVLGGRDPAEELRYWDWYVRQDLRVLRRYMEGLAVRRPYWIVAISVLTEHTLTGEPMPPADVSSYLAVAALESARVDPGWTRLGFDVSDQYLLSGLSNCGYTAEEMRLARDRWAGSLNQYHLFEDPVIAWQFKEFSDRRVSEHQPFYVWGLWLVEQVHAP